jgi:nucleotide-binding universal stress UspA family protein
MTTLLQKQSKGQRSAGSGCLSPFQIRRFGRKLELLTQQTHSRASSLQSCGRGFGRSPERGELDMTDKTFDSTYHFVAKPAADRGVHCRTTRFVNVVVGVDGSAAGRDAIALGAMLRDPRGRLTLAHVSVGNGATLSFDTKPATPEAREMLERERARTGVIAEVRDVASVSVGRGLHQLAEQFDADLLVVGSCSRGILGRVFIGNDTRESLNGASCAVAVAPHGYAESNASFKTVGVGYNATPEADAALAVARGLAARYGATVRALTAVNPIPGGLAYWESFDPDWGTAIAAVARASNERLHSLDGVDGSVVVGIPSEALAAFGAEVGLLVVGSRSYGALRRLMLGSTSLHLARRTPCPLLVLPRPAGAGHEQHEGWTPANLSARCWLP